MQSIQNSIAPFGGLQVILCGDFFQLPPVSNEEEKNSHTFKASIWNEMTKKICYLNEQHKHDKDKKYREVLNSIRNNKADRKTLSV